MIDDPLIGELKILEGLCVGPQDSEEAHGVADNALCSALRKLGREDIADAFERAKQYVDFWYA